MVLAVDPTTLTLANAQFRENRAQYGGAIYAQGKTSTKLLNVTLKANQGLLLQRQAPGFCCHADDRALHRRYAGV